MLRYKKTILVGLLIFLIIFASNKLFALFPLKHIKIKGEFVNIIPSEMVANLELKDLGNFFIVNITQIKAVLQQQSPWIDQIVVSRMWPDQLNISMTEKKMLGFFNNNAVVTAKCEVIYPKILPKQRADFINFKGPVEYVSSMCDFYYKYTTKLDNQDLMLTSLIRDENNSWSIILNKKITLVLGTQNIEDRALNFLKHYSSIIKSYPNIEYMDMRYAQGIALR